MGYRHMTPERYQTYRDKNYSFYECVGIQLGSDMDRFRVKIRTVSKGVAHILGVRPKDIKLMFSKAGYDNTSHSAYVYIEKSVFDNGKRNLVGTTDLASCKNYFYGALHGYMLAVDKR